MANSISGIFVHLDTATLTELHTEFKACLKAIAVAGQSYSIAGRTFSRANLAEVSNTLAELSYALKVNTGGLSRTVYADLSE